ncbi:MAG: bifunctional oligoribonuclease/PAP phosphatase NrnA [Clostridia bacterium]|nr:bifunctional oligoribonuclease/PAP phosphatase NrnA [Clostridia bacterium]
MKTIRNNDTIAGLQSAVSAADCVLLFAHISPDGDALGSTLALSMLMEQMGKTPVLALDGAVPQQLRFLPGWERFTRPEDVKVTGKTLAISVDVSCPERMGTGYPLYQAADVHMVIDHHATNEGFGEFNWIDGKAPASAVLIYRLYQALEMPISKDAALCLYTALSTDTGNFIYDSVNSECFSIMEGLMNAGLDLSTYSRLLFRTKEKSFVRILAETLPTLRIIADGEIAGLQTTMEQMNRAGADPYHVDGVVDYAIDLEEVKMAYYAHEKPEGGIKFSLRSIAPYRIDEVAAKFGGGGHHQASGCTVNLPMAEAVAQVEAALTAALEGQKSL